MDFNSNEISQEDIEGLTNLLKKDFDRKELQRVSVKGFKSVTSNPIEALFLSVKGTIIIEIFTNPFFWIPNACYWIPAFFRCWYSINSQVNLNPAVMSTPATIVSFLIVFYTGTSFSRYEAQYTAAAGIPPKINTILFISKEILRPAVTTRLYRLLHAVHLLAYVGFEDHYNENSFFTPLNKKYSLLTMDEVVAITQSMSLKGGFAYRKVLSWVIRVIKKEKEKGHITGQDMHVLFSHLFEMSARIAVIYSYNNQPIPFTYVLFVKICVNVFSIIYAYFVASCINIDQSTRGYLNEFIVGGMSVFVFTFMMIGLKAIGEHIQDPFGNSLEDLAVTSFIISSIETSKKIVFAPTPKDDEEEDYEYEEDLIQTEKYKDYDYNNNDKSRRLSLISTNSQSLYSFHDDGTITILESINA